MSTVEESPVTQLFDEYREAREKGRPVDVQGLLLRAGAAAGDLEARMRVLDDLLGLSQELKAKVEQSHTPKTVGRFQILRSLGRGGIGHVYLAHDPELRRTVALKVLDRKLVRDQAERLWALNEARSLAHLVHPGVVQVFAVGEADGFDFVAMEHLNGPSLGDVIAELRRIDLPRSGEKSAAAREAAQDLRSLRARVSCLQRIASALAYCHNRGVIHRDVKPDNVVFDENGTPKLLDFGLAHLVEAAQEDRPGITQILIGSAGYLAPEQVEEGRAGADARSDQFSFSTLAYELLALEHPFGSAGPSNSQIMQAIARAEPKRLSRVNRHVPRDLELVIHHGLERSPDARYGTIQELADDLQAILEHRPISVAPPSLPRRAWLFARRHRTVVALGAVAILSVSAEIATSILRERTGILSRLEEVDAAALETPVQFFDAAMVLNQLKDQASSFDRGFLRRWAGPPLSPEVQSSIHAWSGRMGRAFASAGDAQQQGEWRMVFQSDKRLCPEFMLNQAFRDRGRVELPLAELHDRESRFQRMIPAKDPTELVAFEDVEIVDKPAPGAYRLLVWEEGATRLTAELHFVVAREWEESRRIELQEPDPELYQLALSFARSKIPQGRPNEAPQIATIPAFRILPEPVTTGEFRRFLAATGWCPGHMMTRSDEDSAWVDLESATRYASWVGGRLPSNEELWVAFQEGTLLLDKNPPGPDVITSEWVCNLEAASLNGCLTPHAPLLEGRPPMETLGFNPVIRTLMSGDGTRDRRAGVSFRVVFSDDAPEAYFELQRAK